jgi:hypothetical protein
VNFALSAGVAATGTFLMNRMGLVFELLRPALIGSSNWFPRRKKKASEFNFKETLKPVRARAQTANDPGDLQMYKIS